MRLDTDAIRAKTPIDGDRTITFLIDPTLRTSSRTGTLYATVIDHSTSLIVGAHPNLYEFPFSAIVGID